MANVNQPPLKIPKQWLENHEMRGFGNELTMFLYQLWRRTGGADSGGGFDQIEANTNNLANVVNGIDSQHIDSGMFEQVIYESVESEAYTTFTNQIVKLSKDVTVTLNPTPLDKERVYIKSTGKGFTVTSDKKIDGNVTIRYSRPYIGRWFSYSAELDTWSIL